jgi:hypothetical protein
LLKFASNELVQRMADVEAVERPRADDNDSMVVEKIELAVAS